MKATITSKGQITIPVRIRERLQLKEGDVLEFDEEASILKARRYIDPKDWNRALAGLRRQWRKGLAGHPWEDKSALGILDETRGEVEVPDAPADEVTQP